MSIANPLTASSTIQRAYIPKQQDVNNELSLTADYGVYTKDVVEISQLGLESQQNETLLEASRSIEDIANEVINISSTIGRAQAVGNLTHSQATDLYRKISALL